MKYWRTFACVLALGIGGLAVCAEECLRGAAPAGKERRAKAAAPSEPAVPSPSPMNAPALPLPSEPLDADPSKVVVVPMVPLAPPIIQTGLELPLSKPADPTPPPVPALPMPPSGSTAGDLPPPPPVIGLKPMASSPVSGLTLLEPPVALPPATPVAPKFDPPPATVTPRCDPPSVPSLSPAPPTPLTPPVPPPPVPAVSGTKPASTGQYKLYLRMGGSTSTRFEIRDGDQLVLKVYCDQIELHGNHDGGQPAPGVTATGKVRFHGSGLDGTCDQLSIVSTKGEVSLKGTVRLTCYRGTTASQVAADSVMFQLTRTGETVTKMKAAGLSSVVPASMPIPR